MAANGVEGYRQKTPSNIVDITELLLAAGADVDAVADLYDAECTTLGLAATNVHPQRAGVQEELLAILLAHGADIDAPASAGRSPSIVDACLANGRLEAAAYLAKRGARIDFAGACGLHDGFINASLYGRREIVALLLDQNATLLSLRSADGQTGLHSAIIGSHIDVVHLLIERGASLEIENEYGGTPLGQAPWSAAHGGDADRYVAILEALATAGAKIPARHAPVSTRIDAWLALHDSRAEPAWRWD